MLIILRKCTNLLKCLCEVQFLLKVILLFIYLIICVRLNPTTAQHLSCVEFVAQKVAKSNFFFHILPPADTTDGGSQRAAGSSTSPTGGSGGAKTQPVPTGKIVEAVVCKVDDMKNGE